ncbi:unnamed protein product [Boreogadus saida]
MGLNGSFLRSFTMVILLVVCCGERKCNYKEIHDSYRNIILVELQSLNLTSKLNISKERDHCPSAKAHHILRSIHGMIQQFRCHRGKKPATALEKPVDSMEQLLTYNCRQNMVKQNKVCPARKTKGKRRRLKRIIIIKALINCWQKFQSILSLTLSKNRKP